MSYDPETGLYTGYIYYIENLINHKGYIGQTIRTVDERWREHVYRAKENAGRNMAICRAILKYGPDNFEVTTLYTISKGTKEDLICELDKLEIKSIREYDTYCHNGYGYNVSSGGSGGNGRTYRKVTSFDINGNKLYDFDRYNEAARYYGISLTTISKICNGKQYNYNEELVFRHDGDSFDKYPVLNPKENYGVYQFDVNGNLVAKYKSLNYAFTSTGIGFDTIDIIGDPHSLRGGYWWSYEPVFKYEGMSTKKAVDVYDMKTLEFIETFPSLVECADNYNIGRRLIGAVCQGIQKTSHGKIFRYHGDPLDKYDCHPRGSGCCGSKVNKYTKNNEYICTYDYLSQACKDIGIKHSGGISACCRGDQKTSHGFKWFYADDSSQPDKSKIISKE